MNANEVLHLTLQSPESVHIVAEVLNGLCSDSLVVTAILRGS
jgi:hypothetical protein